MDLNDKLFAYPILSSDTDDYIESRFDVVPTLENTQDRKLFFHIKIDLKDKKLEDLIKNKQAEFVIHFECPLTCFREIHHSTSRDLQITIDEEALKEQINISSFIVARDEILDYSNPNFNEDYTGLSFDFQKGNILAIGSSFKIPLDKKLGDIKRLPSIFSICKAENLRNTNIEYNLEDEKIAIILSDELFSHYNSISTLPSLNPITHSLLIIPALQYIFDLLETRGVEEYQDKRWYKVLEKTLMRLKPEMNFEQILERYPSYQLAQTLMSNPLEKSFQTIINLYDDE